MDDDRKTPIEVEFAPTNVARKGPRDWPEHIVEMPIGYILNEDESISPSYDFNEWGRFFQDHKRRVIGRTTVGDKTVSTVFLATDHNFSFEGPPILFETMIFREAAGAGIDKREWDDFQVRYRTIEEARAGHAETVELLRLGLNPIQEDDQ